MIIYFIIISITLVYIALLNGLIGINLYTYDWFFVIKITLLNILVIFLIDAFLAFVIHKLPLRWFDHRKKCFHIFKWERKFYEKIKIKKWKDHIPELGTLANFRKNKVLEPNNNIYVQKFLTECCYGEMIHFLSIIFGILIIFIAPKYFLLLGFPVVVANALMNYLSFAILRYTRPKLSQLYKRNCRKEKTNL